MKKQILLLTILLVLFMGCRKDDPIPQSLPKTSEIPSNPDNQETPLTREDILFRRLANACLQGEASCNVTDLNVEYVSSDEAVYSEHKHLFDTFLKKYPYFFHIKRDGSLSLQVTEDYKHLELYRFNYTINYDDISEWIPKVEEHLEDYYSSLKEGMSQAEVAYALYYKMTQKTHYHDGLYSGDVLGALTEGFSVCQGYSYTYFMLLESLGLVPTEHVRGLDRNSMREHVWNRVQIDGEWYNMDVTWDDHDKNKKTSSSCFGEYFLTSDDYFYNTLKHPQAYKIPKIPNATSRRFEGDECVFRITQSEPLYLNGFWYYLSKKDMCIYKSRFNGDEKTTIRQILRDPEKIAEDLKQIAFGEKDIYFIDNFENNKKKEDWICSVGYDGQNFKKIKKTTYYELATDAVSLKRREDKPVQKEFGVLALRAELVLAKLKDAYYHGTEDFLKAEDPRRVNFLKIIQETEKLLENKSPNANKARELYEKLHATRKSYSMPVTSRKK